MWLFREIKTVIRGGGDLASGVAYRLVKAGFPVFMTELATPLFVRRAVSFGNAIYEGGAFTVEGITSHVVHTMQEAQPVLDKGQIPVFIDEKGALLRDYQPDVVIDARLQKNPLDTSIHDAPHVVALGPGFEVGTHCHAVVETNRGHFLGRVIWHGTAQQNTGTPGIISGYSAERVIRAPTRGHILPRAAIGTKLDVGEEFATINGIALRAAFPGVLRGLIHPSVEVWKGLKVADIDPRGEALHCFTISDKSLAVGGGVLEAILSAEPIQKVMLHNASV